MQVQALFSALFLNKESLALEHVNYPVNSISKLNVCSPVHRMATISNILYVINFSSSFIFYYRAGLTV